MGTLKIGVLGCGKIAERHILAYRKLPTEVVIADVVTDAAQRMAERYGMAFRDHPDEILNDPTVTAVDICVPTVHHRDAILEALAHGKHIFCEKPLCRTLTEAHEIQQVARQSERVLMVGYLQRFHPAFQMVKEALDEGIIGRPYFALFRVGGRGDHATWKHQHTAGGGAVLEMLVHKLDQLVWFFGPAERVEVLIYNTLRPVRTIRGEQVQADAEDLVVLEIEAGGVRVLCEGDFVTPSYMDHMEVQGDNGSIFSSLLHFMPTIIHCKEKRGLFNEGSNFYNFPMVNLFESELTHFIETIENGHRNNINSLEDSIHVMEIIEHIWQHANYFRATRR
jgi:predicted dehydrogenase